MSVQPEKLPGSGLEQLMVSICFPGTSPQLRYGTEGGPQRHQIGFADCQQPVVVSPMQNVWGACHPEAATEEYSS